MIRISDLSLSRREHARSILDEMKKSASSSSCMVWTYLSARTARSMSHGSSCSVFIRSYIMDCQESSFEDIRLKNWSWFILSSLFIIC